MKTLLISIFMSANIGMGIGVVVGYRQGEAVLTALGPAAWIGHGLAERNAAFVKHTIFMGGLWGVVLGGIFVICFHRWRLWRSQVARAV